METTMIDDEVTSSECSNSNNCEEEHHDDEKKTNDQDVHQVDEKFSGLMIDDYTRAVEINLFKGRRSKDECMFCPSKLLVSEEDGIFCKNCLLYQRKPKEVRLPTITPTIVPTREEIILNSYIVERSKNQCMFCASKILVLKNGEMLCNNCYTYQIIPMEIHPPTTTPIVVPTKKMLVCNSDGPSIVELPKGTCQYCCRTHWFQMANEKICSYCHRSETTGYLIHLDQKQLDSLIY